MADKWQSASWVAWFPFGVGRWSPVIDNVVVGQNPLTFVWGDPAPNMRVYYIVAGGANACGLKPQLQAAFPGLLVKSAPLPAGVTGFSVIPGPPDPPGTIICP